MSPPCWLQMYSGRHRAIFTRTSTHKNAFSILLTSFPSTLALTVKYQFTCLTLVHADSNFTVHSGFGWTILTLRETISTLLSPSTQTNQPPVSSILLHSLTWCMVLIYWYCGHVTCVRSVLWTHKKHIWQPPPSPTPNSTCQTQEITSYVTCDASTYVGP